MSDWCFSGLLDSGQCHLSINQRGNLELEKQAYGQLDHHQELENMPEWKSILLGQEASSHPSCAKALLK